MKFHRLLPAVALLAVLAPCAARAQDTSSHVGVANFIRIFYALDETTGFNNEIGQEAKVLQQDDTSKRSVVEQLGQELKTFKPGTPQYEDKRKEVDSKKIEYTVWLETKKAELTRRQKLELKAIFDRVRDGVAKVAALHHMDLVIAEIRPDIPDELENVSVDDIRARIQQCNVLYTGDKVDISDEVIATLNAAYKAAHQ